MTTWSPLLLPKLPWPVQTWSPLNPSPYVLESDTKYLQQWFVRTSTDVIETDFIGNSQIIFFHSKGGQNSYSSEQNSNPSSRPDVHVAIEICALDGTLNSFTLGFNMCCHNVVHDWEEATKDGKSVCNRLEIPKCHSIFVTMNLISNHWKTSSQTEI